MRTTAHVVDTLSPPSAVPPELVDLVEHGVQKLVSGKQLLTQAIGCDRLGIGDVTAPAIDAMREYHPTSLALIDSGEPLTRGTGVHEIAGTAWLEQFMQRRIRVIEPGIECPLLHGATVFLCD